MNYLKSSSDDDCSMFDYSDETPHRMQQRDASSPPPHRLPKKIVSPLTTSQECVSLSVEQKHVLHAFPNIINNGMRRDMSPSSEEGIDSEMVELHHFGILPMFPIEAFGDDIMDNFGTHCHQAQESPPTTIYLQPRVPIHGCQIPPVAPSLFMQQHEQRCSPPLNSIEGEEVPTFKDLGLLPMVLSSDDQGFSNESNDTRSVLR